MDILPRVQTPRLIATVAPYAPDRSNAPDLGVAVAGESRSGAGRWWFLGMLLAAALLAASAHIFHDRFVAFRQHQRELRLLRVETQRLATAPHSNQTPFPMTINYSPEMLQVSAIALGHPRLAVINGRMLIEGDSLVLHTPTHNVAVTLRVTKIADGYVDLTDGTHTITTHLTVPSTKR